MTDGPRSRRPVDIKDGGGDDAGDENEVSRPLRPARSARPPKVDTGSAPRRSDAPPVSQRRDSGPVSRRARGTPKPPAVTPKPPGVTPRPPGVTPKPRGVTPKPPAATAKAKTASRAKKKVDPRDRLDSHAEGFFAEGEAASQRPDALDDAPHGLPAESIFSVERRATLMKYVGVLLVISTVLCVAAIIRSVSTPVAPAHEASLAPVAPSAAPAIPAPPAIPAIPSAVAATPPTAVASSAPAPAASASAPVAEVASAPLAPTKSASEEKADAQRALDRGKAKDAIEAATRSTAIDPTDGDAWLLLGAANMELGKSAEARAAFSACAKQATKGQVGECRSMLR